MTPPPGALEEARAFASFGLAAFGCPDEHELGREPFPVVRPHAMGEPVAWRYALFRDGRVAALVDVASVDGTAKAVSMRPVEGDLADGLALADGLSGPTRASFVETVPGHVCAVRLERDGGAAYVDLVRPRILDEAGFAGLLAAAPP